MITCKHCGEAAKWSDFLDTYWCPECRTDDVEARDRAQRGELLDVEEVEEDPWAPHPLYPERSRADKSSEEGV